MSMNEWDDDDYGTDDDDDFCTRCHGTGRIPAFDYEAIEGHEYFACPECEKGLNSGYPWRGTEKTTWGQPQPLADGGSKHGD